MVWVTIWGFYHIISTPFNFDWNELKSVGIRKYQNRILYGNDDTDFLKTGKLIQLNQSLKNGQKTPIEQYSKKGRNIPSSPNFMIFRIPEQPVNLNRYRRILGLQILIQTLQNPSNVPPSKVFSKSKSKYIESSILTV